jgi:hypothetical protein
VRPLLPIFVALGVVALAAGCGGGGSGEASSREENRVDGAVTTVASPEKAAAVLAEAKQEWRQILDANAEDDPATRFDNLTEGEFLARVREAAREYGFRVVEARWLEPLQAAPLVVVESDDPASLTRDVPAIARLLDPQAPVGEDWEGWAFEGFFLEVRDQNGVPFLAVYNHWRGSDRGGGEWARSEDLYPFPHG